MSEIFNCNKAKQLIDIEEDLSYRVYIFSHDIYIRDNIDIKNNCIIFKILSFSKCHIISFLTDLWLHKLTCFPLMPGAEKKTSRFDAKIIKHRFGYLCKGWHCLF